MIGTVGQSTLSDHSLGSFVAKFRMQGIVADSVESLPRLNSSIASFSPHESGIAGFDELEQLQTENEEWSEAKNHRRCELINRKYAGGLNADQTSELALLQEQMLRYSQRVAPLPIEAARRLYQKLLAELNGSKSPTDS
jgi:hypothetical protein